MLDKISSNIAIGLALTTVAIGGYFIIKTHFERGLLLKQAVRYQEKQAILRRMRNTLSNDYNFDINLINKTKVKCTDKLCNKKLSKGFLDGFKNIN